MDTVRLTFCGGAGSVTGANFLLEAAGLRILVDCGMMQGSRFAEEENRKPFPYNPSDIDFLLVTHAHIDHTGRIPKLVADGFKGKILSTPETHALARLMLEDALKLIEEECRTTGELPLYEHKDVVATLALWRGVPYHQPVDLGKGFSVYSKDAGHVLGSAMFEITQTAGLTRNAANAEPKRKIVFTGDLGNSPSPILRDTESVRDADYIVMESVYGDRNHEGEDMRREHLRDVIVSTIARKGTLIIPTFSLEKTQVLLYELHELEEASAIPAVSVFLDSPLAIGITEVYVAMRRSLNKHAQAETGNLFSFPRLKLTRHSEESKSILSAPAPKIIIAGSGMSHGGRILHHEINYLPHAENTILFLGYQAAGSLGRQIQEGMKEVMINGQRVTVRARVQTISGYSSHKDSEHLVEFVHTAAEGGTLKKVFLCMGEPKAASFLAQRIRDYAGAEASVPEVGEQVILD